MTGSLMAPPLQPIAQDGVGGHQRKGAKSKYEKDEIEHRGPPFNDGGEMRQPA